MNGFKIAFLIKLIKYKIYSIIFYFLVTMIFILSLFVESSSKIQKISIAYFLIMIDVFIIMFYIPITEIILIPIKCVDGKVYGFTDGENCWENLHYINMFLGIIGTILLFIWCIFMLYFSFYPFQSLISTTRISSNNDIIVIIMKLILILQNFYLLIKAI